jgi:aspartokinase
MEILIIMPPASHKPAGDAGILVRKYGGSSLATVERIKAIARDIRLAHDLGHQVVVVVSAMGTTTNELEVLAREASPNPPRREMDMLLSVGERITMSLLSMALAAEGCPAISFTGSQCGIITDTSHTDARIIEVRGDRVREALAQGYTVVVAGFQGVSMEKEITTLGRGGSDTTAVALAAALGAIKCEILKDVDGVMSADPSVVGKAWIHENLSWDEMREIATSGCGVVHLRAVEYAARFNVPLVVRSSFHRQPGTTIGPMGSNSEKASTDRENRYRPLVIHVDRDLASLRLGTTDATVVPIWRDMVLIHLEPTEVIAEWLDSGSDFRWEALAPENTLQTLRDLLLEAREKGEHGPGNTIDLETGLSCISFSGGRPDSWLEVQRHLGSLLDDLGCSGWRLRVDGSSLRVLVPGILPLELPEQLHQALLPD